MELILIAGVIGIIIIIYLLVIVIHNQKRIRMNRRLYRFSQLVSKKNLNFSGQQIFPDRIMGLDGVNRKLLILHETAEGRVRDMVIDLNEVKSCSLRKYYGTINAGELRGQTLDQYLKKIVLHFEFKDGREAAEVLFYSHDEGGLHHAAQSEQKARDWEAVLSKMLRAPLKRSA